jgi:Fe-S-cluster-containing dehydrogenase component
MAVDRRSLLKGALATGAAAVGGAFSPTVALARERREAPEDALGLLFDATKCIGCKACVVGCREANGLPPESSTGLWDDPQDLSAGTKNIIKLFRGDDGTVSFMKSQCMHCVDPACVSVCMLGAYSKGEFGIIEYDESKCIGCRYCQLACPFNIPKFQWDRALPVLTKCELCRHRYIDGRGAACAEVCPTGAVIFGRRAELLEEAHRRLAENPGRYQPKVYGEHEGGGTQVLYLSAVPFTDLGLPELGDQPVPHLSETIQHGIYKGFIAPVALYGVLAGVLLRNRRRGDGAAEEEES